MKCPVCNSDLLMGERLTVRTDCCPKYQCIWPEKEKPDILPDKAGGIGSSFGKGDQWRSDDDKDKRGSGGFLHGLFD